MRVFAPTVAAGADARAVLKFVRCATANWLVLLQLRMGVDRFLLRDYSEDSLQVGCLNQVLTRVSVATANPAFHKRIFRVMVRLKEAYDLRIPGR